MGNFFTGGYQSPEHFRQSYGGLAGSLQQLGVQRKMRQAEQEVLQLAQAGRLDQNALLAIPQKYKLPPQAFRAILDNVKVAMTVGAAQRQQKFLQGMPNIPGNVTLPPGTTREQMAFQTGIYGQPGMRFLHGVGPEEAIDLEKIDTVDAQGNPVTRFVAPKPGAEYRKPTKKTTGKNPLVKPMENTSGEWTYHQWDDATKNWVDTGRGASAPKDLTLGYKKLTLPNGKVMWVKPEPGVEYEDYQKPKTAQERIAEEGWAIAEKEGMESPNLKPRHRLAMKVAKGRREGPTPAQALRQIAQIKKDKYLLSSKLAESNKVSEALAAMIPSLADRVGQSLSDTDKEELFKAWDDQTKYLEKFTGEGQPKGTLQDRYNHYRKQGKDPQEAMRLARE